MVKGVFKVLFRKKNPEISWGLFSSEIPRTSKLAGKNVTLALNFQSRCFRLFLASIYFPAVKAEFLLSMFLGKGETTSQLRFVYCEVSKAVNGVMNVHTS